MANLAKMPAQMKHYGLEIMHMPEICTQVDLRQDDSITFSEKQGKNSNLLRIEITEKHLHPASGYRLNEKEEEGGLFLSQLKNAFFRIKEILMIFSLKSCNELQIILCSYTVYLDCVNAINFLNRNECINEQVFLFRR